MAINIEAITNTARNGLKKFSGKPLAITSKALGVATVASVIYDAHVNGKERAEITDEIKSADSFYKNYKQYTISNKASATVAQMKKDYFLGMLTFPGKHFNFKAGGYLSEFCNTILRNLPRLALASVSLAFNKAGKVAGCLLGFSWLQTYLHEVVGIGQKKSEINK